MLAEAAGIKKSVIACGRTDLRKSIDGLAQLISTGYEPDPFHGQKHRKKRWNSQGNSISS